MRMYSVYDTKAEQYGTPVYCRTDAEARRQFGQVVNDENTEFAKHPEDFLLYRVGSFDQESGIVTAEPATCVARAIEFKKENNNE